MTDSLLTSITYIASKIDQLDDKITVLTKKATLNFWTPIISALIAAIIGTLIAQWIDRYRKNQFETQKELREIHSVAVNLKIKLRDYFRQLAMYKFHAQYWWHLHYTEDASEDFRNKYYEEHLRSQAEARDTEKEIGNAKAEFLAQIVKFEKLKGQTFNVDQEKQTIENIQFEKAKSYDLFVSQDKLREELAEKDEKDLREQYFKQLEVFQQIIDKMI